MSKFINVAAVHFEINAERGAPDAQQKVLEKFKTATDCLDGTGVGLLLTCEGMEAIGQTIDQAESSKNPGPIYNAYRDFAMRNKCTVAGSIKLEDDGRIYNALAFIGPGGEFLGDYRKTYLTTREVDMGISPGAGATVVDTPAGRIGGVICFDLNYDELRDGYHDLKPDILAFSSMFHGDHLQRNWAYQCRSFLASACKDSSSDIVDPLGRVVAAVNYHGRIVRSKINLDRFVMHQDENVDSFSDIQRKYKDEIRIDYNPILGVAVLYSESSKRSADIIAHEFGLVSLDDYLQNSKKYKEGKKC
jgi:Carbon-nitrogen hydrolase